ncbi:MAG: lysophospholipid acyltransferase family protein [Acidobacteria bacterium]|nr:lysophospholipid acyltransferase family protein [Acidobacteriota bacterium]MCI0624858.1 lysophospholipid acyltransferase family protein [Acidobacteriota bacterium]MCI0719337.1 lysophospholipid acyltransferase family protein [Acidobacteriota bacterium]
MANVESQTSNSAPQVPDSEPQTLPRGLAYHSAPRRFSFWQKLQITFFSRTATCLLNLIGKTLRWQSQGDEHLERIYKDGKRAIMVCWHGRIFPSTYYWRHRGIVVMSSQNFDGECLAHGLRKLGYGVARGSSSRGGLKALAEMARCLRSGKDAGFTVDGPRGPRYEVKPGPVLLAKRTGDAVLCFDISLQSKIQLNTWDQMQIPLPFSKALILKAPPIYVPRDANEGELQDKIAEMQWTLDDLRKRGDAHWMGKGQAKRVKDQDEDDRVKAKGSRVKNP